MTTETLAAGLKLCPLRDAPCAGENCHWWVDTTDRARVSMHSIKAGQKLSDVDTGECVAITMVANLLGHRR